MITDKPPYQLIPEPTSPSPPSRGQSFTDPNFGTTLVRVTGPEDGTLCRISYGIWSAFSCDYRRILVQCDGRFKLFAFDPVSGSVGDSTELPASFQGADAIWSHTDPNLIYHRDGGSRLMLLNIKTGIDNEIWNAAEKFPESPNLARMSASSDDNIFCFARQTSDYDFSGFCVVNLKAGSIYHEPDSRKGNYFKVQIDKSGKFMWNVAKDPESEWWDLTQPNTQIPLLTPGTGHSAMLRGCIAQYDNTANTDVLRAFSGATEINMEMIAWPDWDLANEYSGTDDNKKEDLYAVTTGTLKPQGVLHDELIQVSTDGSGTIRRLCHLHNVMRSGDYDTIPQPATGYGAFPWIAFHSSWGDSGRRDVFLAKAESMKYHPAVKGVQRLEYLALYGSGMKGGSVSIGGVPAVVSYDSDTQINVEVPSSLIGQGEKDLVVTASGSPSPPIKVVV